METVTIRDLSGAFIARASEAGEILGVTNMGALVGVLVPLTRDVLRRMAIRDAAQVRERLGRAEESLALGQPVSTVSELLREDAQSGGQSGPDRVSIRQLSGARLEQAARDGHTLIITSGRVSLALLIPITPSWLEHWVEGEIARFIDGSPPGQQEQEEREERRGGNGGTEPAAAAAAEESLLAPAVAMITPRQDVLAQRGSTGREVAWQRVIGIRIDADPADDKGRLLGIVTDTAAKVLGEPISRELASIDESDVYNAILGLIDDLKARMGPHESLLGIGIEMGGHMHDGQIITSFNVHWEEFSLADRLNAVFGLPVVVENDANALAILERRFHGVKEDHLAVVLVTYQGVGCGLIVDGHLYRGSRGMAGELGHIPVGVQPSAHGREGQPGDGWHRCRCGNPYCLETVATPRAIGQASQTRDIGGYEAAKRLMSEDRDVRSNFERAGQALGWAVASVINLFNPSAVVFYGPTELFGRTRSFHIDPDIRDVTDNISYVTDNSPYLVGAVTGILDNQFSAGVSECLFIVRRPADDQRARAAAACLINRIMPTSRILESRPVTIQSPRPAPRPPATGEWLVAARRGIGSSR